jgi:tRNA (guanine-N7-)-methyltransferase
VRREGRLTAAQARALDTLWPRFGLAPPVDLDAAFGRRAPRHLEIGFGSGEALLSMAQCHPENDYLGIEVYRPGVGALLARAAGQGVRNLRLMQGDAAELLPSGIPDGSLAAIYVFFPDPWPKKRHHKRRLIGRGFLDLLAEKLQVGGYFYMATDWADYAQQALHLLEGHGDFCNLAGCGRFAARPAERPLTKFESRGRQLGHEISDLAFERVAAPGAIGSASPPTSAGRLGAELG